MRIIFMGTPEFAAESFAALLSGGYDIPCVFTQPDKPKGRKQILTQSEVKQLALKRGIDVFQPSTLKAQEIVDLIAGFEPDLIVVAAYGKILPKSVLDIPKMGCINVHGSVLPKYRGAAPIQWSVINGEKETGITTMLMDEGLDTGDILLTETTAIYENETSGELYGRLAKIGADLLVKTIQGLSCGKIIPQKQGNDFSYAPPLDKSLAEIDFNNEAIKIHNLIRGLNPWPIAYTKVKGKLLKIYTSKVSQYSGGRPGEVMSEIPFIVACGEGTSIEVTNVQIEGKKAMEAPDFMHGSAIKIGDILGE